MNTAFRENMLGLLAALLFVFLATAYSVSTPLWIPPDEDRHFVYCAHIAREKTLPYLDASETGYRIAQAIHPPLYYLATSLLMDSTMENLYERVRINEGSGYAVITHPEEESRFPYTGIARTAHILRLLSIFWSALTVYLVYVIMRQIFPSESVTALAAALLAAVNPQFLHISASISNEPMSTAFATLLLLILIQGIKTGFNVRRQILAGVVFGCCMLIKTSAAVYAPLTVLALAMHFRRRPIQVCRACALIIGTGFAIAGWWYLRNMLVYGDPMFTDALNQMQPWSLRSEPLSMEYACQIIKMTYMSFFGMFGAMQIQLSMLHYSLYAVLIAGAGVGMCRLFFQRNIPAMQAQCLLLCGGALFFAVALYGLFNFRYTMFMGRYLFIVLAPIAVLVIAGVRALLPQRHRRLLLILISILLVAASLDVFFRVLRPAFGELHLTAGIEQRSFAIPTPSIDHGPSVKQDFISPHDNLCAIRVMFSRADASVLKDMRFVLMETGANSRIISNQILRAEALDDFSRVMFIFPPIPRSAGQRYEFYFEPVDAASNTTLALWYDNTVAPEGGTLYFNETPASGALYYATYHFTGNKPRSDWEGRRHVYINQGWYVTVRELQLYGEVATGSPLWKHTDKKIRLLQQAVHDRSHQPARPAKNHSNGQDG
jgi:hypothetical protein